MAASSETKTIAIRGGCLCKAITYAILPPSKEELANPDPTLISGGGKITGSHCHCDECRNATGALFMTCAEIPIQRIKIVDSRGSLTSFRVSAAAVREHCRICGSTMWMKYTGWDDPETGRIDVCVGTMNKHDAKKWINLRHHIFMGDTINGGVWEFEDSLPKLVPFGRVLTPRYVTRSDKGEWKRA